MLKYVALAAAAGFFLPLQALINARTSAVLGSTLWATLINFVCGTVLLIALITLTRTALPTLEQVNRIPAYGWFGCIMGALYVGQAPFTVPKLGAAAMVALVIAGQMFGSIAFDYFGVLQTPHAVGWQKLLGAVLLLAGVWLILQRTE